MTQWTFAELAQRVLADEQKPLSPGEIWQAATSRGYDKNVKTQGKTPWKSLGAQIYVDLRDNVNSPFAKVGVRPVRFHLKALQSPGGAAVAASTPAPTGIPASSAATKVHYLEQDLHPFLSYYGSLYLRAYLKTIRHNVSAKAQYREWLHPDMVGCYFPIGEWDAEVLDLSSAMGSVAVRLYSFELKRELNFGNLRESFFQAVSNSSWAHEGYLAAAEVSTDEDFRGELRRLSSSFGIGIIRIDIDDPDATEILFPARPRENPDWDAIDKLARTSPDFREFLKRIRIDLTSKEIRKERYDAVHDKTVLISRIKKVAAGSS